MKPSVLISCMETKEEGQGGGKGRGWEGRRGGKEREEGGGRRGKGQASYGLTQLPILFLTNTYKIPEIKQSRPAVLLELTRCEPVIFRDKHLRMPLQCVLSFILS